jgi:predicted NBD/HSP70 family sugar kinase
VVFGVIMGTGVGGGLVVNGKIVAGMHGIGGEWGHNFLDESGGKCYCGKIGCVETVISGPFTERYYTSLSGQEKNLKEITDLHAAGSDQNATKTIHRLTHFFGKAISVVIDIVDPDVVVIGGGVGNVDYLYTDGVQSARKHVFNDYLETRFLKPELGDSAGVFGAAMLVAD